MPKAIRMIDADEDYFYLCPYYPVGAIYLSFNPTNPSNFFGGEWEQLKDMFLLAGGDNYPVGTSGGEATHTLSVDEMPSHNHNFSNNRGSGSMSWGGVTGVTKVDGVIINYPNTSTTGGNLPHNNMPPYISVYMWRRIK